MLTTLLDETVTPALELAARYHQRWDVEAVCDARTTHRWQTRRVLRSKTAALVQQECYGWVLAHEAVRWLRHQAATEHRLPDRGVSFTATGHVFRTAQPHSGAVPPRATPQAARVV